MNNDPDCPICDDTGFLPVPGDPFTLAKCRCTMRRLYRSKLGAEIFDAEPITESEFLEHIENNLFITARREDFLPHLRFCLIKQGMSFFSRQISDSQALDTWLGKEGGHRGPHMQQNPDRPEFRSLRELVEDPDLLVFNLGLVSYPNRALPGVVLEVLQIRRYGGKPTWVVHSGAWGDGHNCYSSELDHYLSENYQHMTVKPSGTRKRTQAGVKAASTPEGKVKKDYHSTLNEMWGD